MWHVVKVCLSNHPLALASVHTSHVAGLLEAILLSAIAGCECTAHTEGGSDPVCRGKHRADVAAKAAATLPPASDLQPLSTLLASLSGVPLIDMQTFSTPAECDLWRKNGCSPFSSELWMSPAGKPCLPKHFCSHFAKLTHWLDHVSKDQDGDRRMVHKSFHASH